ncbi:MAG: hypothetical protein H0T85_05910, partial [Geodermatophilaceae bacterium]|nr:hypothetical protein [Geodermatophilaceae bacterium]
MSTMESGVSEALLARLNPAQRAALTARLAKARAPGVDVVPRLPEGVTPPMSSAQRRLWFLHQYDPEDPSYGIPVAFALDGHLDVDALRRALTDLAAAHDVLHTVYPATDGEPAPTRDPRVRPDLRIVDLGADGAETGTDGALTRARLDVRRPFDLAAGSPMRATVYRQGPGRDLFVLELHHIAADGWSLNLLLAELGRRYGEALAGPGPSAPTTQPPPPLRYGDTAPPLRYGDTAPPLRYGDIAAWQADRLRGDALERELAWWSQTLADAPGPLALPTDRPRPAVATTAGARIERTLPAALTAGVRSGAGRDGVTPFMVWLAGLGVALGRICGTDDLVVGAPVAGRLRAEFEDVVGCFVSTLALRVGTAGDPTGAQLLERVRAGTLAAYDHQELPFETLVDHLSPQRDLSTTALFQVLLNVHNQPLLDLRLQGLQTRWVDIDTATTKFDLNVAVVDTGDRMTVSWTYNRDLFDEATVQRLAAAVEAAIGGLCTTPARPVAT